MTAKPKSDPKPTPRLDGEEVTVTVADMVSNGQGGHFAVGSVIPVSPAQAASLRLQGFAK